MCLFTSLNESCFVAFYRELDAYMLGSELAKTIATGLKGNADALLAFACLCFVGAFLIFGLNTWLAIGVPFLFYYLYSRNQRARINERLQTAKLDFDKTKEQNQRQLTKRKQKLLK